MQLPWDAAFGTVPSWFHTIPSRLHTTSHHFGTYMAPTSATGTLIFDYFGCRRKKSRIPFPARHRSALVTSPGVTSAAYPYGADGPALGPKARTPLWPHGRGESAPVDARRPDVGVAGCERPWEPVALQLWQRHALPNGWGTTVWAEMPGSRRTCARGAPRAGAEDRNDDFYRYCFAFFCPDLSTPNHQAPLRYRHALGSTLAVVHGRGCFTDEPEELRATALEFRLWDLHFGHFTVWNFWPSRPPDLITLPLDKGLTDTDLEISSRNV